MIRARPHLRRRWVVAMCWGELVGFVPPALVGATLAVLGVPEVVLVVALVAAGAAEGAVVGWAQSGVLLAELPGLRRWEWVRATALAAALAWAAGMTGSSGARAVLEAGDGAPSVVVLATWAILVPLLLAGLLAMGVLQWWVLRRYVGRAARWVPVTTMAWLVGVAVPVTALSLVPDGAPAFVHAVVGVLAAVAMGATVGVLSAGTLARLVSRARVTANVAA